jgi:hypothetical protein
MLVESRFLFILWGVARSGDFSQTVPSNRRWKDLPTEVSISTLYRKGTIARLSIAFQVPKERSVTFPEALPPTTAPLTTASEQV